MVELKMKISNKQFLISLFLIIILPLTTCLTMTNSTNAVVPSYGGITKMANEIFVEDFTNDTYMDAGETDAWGWGTGTITNTRNFSWSQLDYFETEDPVVDLDVQGKKAYASVYNTTAGIDSLTILNLENSSDIKKTGGENSWINTLAVEANGDYLYAGQVSVVGYSIVVFDISDPFNPTNPNGWGLLDGAITDIEANGHLIYFVNYNATGGKSLRILNTEDPLFLDLVTCDWGSNKALGLAVQGQIVYVAASDEGFYVLNATNKHHPVESDHLALSGNVTDVIVDGGIAYVAAGDAGVFTIDVRDPTNIAILGQYDTPGNAIDLVLQGKTLFVADGLGGVLVLDVADPNNPSYVSDSSLQYTYCVELYGGILVVGTEEGVYTFNICAGLGVTNLKHYAYENTFSDLQVWDVRVKGDIAYIAGGPDGFYTLNVQDPNNPILLDHFTIAPSESFKKLDVDGNFAHCVDDSGIYLFDISDPSDIEFRSFTIGGLLEDMFSIGELEFVSFTTGFAILNISNPYVPVVLSNNFIGTANLTAIWVQGVHLYVVDNIPGGPIVNSLYIYDITNLAAPVFIGSASVDAQFNDIYVDGDVAYTADKAWMILYNVTNPVGPYFTTFTFGNSLGVWGFGPYCLSADSDEGVSMVNCNNPYAIDPRMSIYPNATNALQVTTHGDYTYVANKTSLVILRHFESAGDTYIADTTTAQSLKVNVPGLVSEATLDVGHYVPAGTTVEYSMSVDGGTTWEVVTLGVAHVFNDSGYDLRWRVVITGPKDRSVHIYAMSIDYTINYSPSIPTLTALGAEKFTGIFKLEWSESNDTDDNVDHYELQISDSNTFGTILKNMTAQGTSKSVFGLGKGTFFFRVRAVDNYGVVSDWSNVESTTVKLATLWIGLIIGGGLLVIVVLIVVISLVVRRKKRTPTR